MTLALLATTNVVALNSLLVKISALVGLGLPLLVSVVQRAHWPNWVRTGIGLIAIVVAAIVTAAAQHKLNVSDWAASALTILVMTETTYVAVWKPAGVAPWLEKITTPKVARRKQ